MSERSGGVPDQAHEVAAVGIHATTTSMLARSKARRYSFRIPPVRQIQVLLSIGARSRVLNMARHVSNEYGGNCYCQTCATEFRRWLRSRYASFDEVNARWWMPFWSHSPDVPVTTNMMGTYVHLDYREWAREVDVISWDCYPWPSADPGDIAFLHDLNRGLKDGRPFMLMEQTPSSQNWQPVNALKRPGVLRLWSYLAVAHGAETVMHFQWRRGRISFRVLG